MKRLLLLAALIPGLASAQVFAPPGATWTYTYAVDNLIDPFPPVYSAHALSVVGDTLLMGHLCSSVEGASLACHQERGFVYQSGDSVFYWDELANSFSLLYRWDATVGENWQVLHTGLGGADTLTYSVVATGTILINGQLRRTLDVQLWDQMSLAFTGGQLIEGIGDLGYLFPWYIALCDGFIMGPLRCYEDSDVGLYMRPGVFDCDITAASTVFAPLGAKWTYEQGSCCGPDTNLMVLEVIGDTVLQGRTFSKLQVNEGLVGCHEFVQFFSESNDSLHYYETDQGQYHLLFRWNALIGESWSTPVEQSGYLDTLDWSVLDTSHTMIDGLWLRSLTVNVFPRQSLIYGYGGTITERLGSFGAPFTWVLGFCDGETFMALRCYEDADIDWLNPQFPQCDLSTGIGEHSASEAFRIDPSLTVAGNPIVISSADVSTHSYRVMDMTGRTVAMGSLANGSATLHVQHAGAYMVMPEPMGAFAAQRVVVY